MSIEVYDPVANPYAPGAGTPPPELVGRDRVIADAQVGLARLAARRSAQHSLLTGLRGVGKTVLLGRLAAVAESANFRPVRVEAVPGDDTVLSLLRQARRLLDDLDRTSLVRRALRSIDSVSLTLLGTGVRIDRDSPDVRPDREALADVVVDLAAAAAEHNLGVFLAIDEAQALDANDIRRLLAGLHRCDQDALPMMCVLAGLPNLVAIVAKATTYAERMFVVTELGPLTPEQVGLAITIPAAELSVEWSQAAVGAIVDRSDGYPFFVQTWGYHVWNAALDEPISLADVERATGTTLYQLDTSFFAARVARVAQSELDYIRALASLGPGSHQSGDIARVRGVTSSKVSATRDRLIREGVVYSPRYGWLEFAIPHFDRYVRRTFAANQR